MRRDSGQNSSSQGQAYSTPSPYGEAAGYAFLVEDNTTRFHPDLRITSGFFIKSSVLNLYDPESRRWVPCVDLAQLPDDVWLRFLDVRGVVLLPVELKRRGTTFYGRWLGVDGRLVPPGVLDDLVGSDGAAVLEAERRRHERVMDSWRRFGGWERGR